MGRSAIWLILAVASLAASAFGETKSSLSPTSANRNQPRPSADVPLGTEPRGPVAGRYRYQNGRWWYLSRDNKWSRWENGVWVPYARAAEQEVARTAPSVASPRFDRRFAAYMLYQVGQGRLQTAEGGEAELATDEIAEPGEPAAVAEAMEMGALPPRQAERQHAGLRRSAEEERPGWFNAGSPFGIRYGYGSGFGYSGYGFNNPYGYGPRTGGGGGFAYGFGPYGSVGGQTGSQMSGAGGGANLIRVEQGSLGSPSQLEKGPVGGSVLRPSRRKLGGSASSSTGRD